MKIILFFTLLLSLNIYAQENYKLMFLCLEILGPQL